MDICMLLAVYDHSATWVLLQNRHLNISLSLVLSSSSSRYAWWSIQPVPTLIYQPIRLLVPPEQIQQRTPRLGLDDPHSPNRRAEPLRSSYKAESVPMPLLYISPQRTPCCLCGAAKGQVGQVMVQTRREE